MTLESKFQSILTNKYENKNKNKNKKNKKLPLLI